MISAKIIVPIAIAAILVFMRWAGKAPGESMIPGKDENGKRGGGGASGFSPIDDPASSTTSPNEVTDSGTYVDDTSGTTSSIDPGDGTTHPYITPAIRAMLTGPIRGYANPSSTIPGLSAGSGYINPQGMPGITPGSTYIGVPPGLPGTIPIPPQPVAGGGRPGTYAI